MFKYLKGKLIKKEEESIVLEVGGVGYEIFCPPREILKMRKGEEIKVYTYLYIKKEEVELYGFLDEEELAFFKFLNKIPGIGPKTATFFASWKNPQKLKEYLESSSLKIKGVGKKKIQKILLELTGKIREMKIEREPLNKDLLEALSSLGVPRNKAKEIAREIDPQFSLEEQIKIAFKMLGEKK